MNYYFLAAGGLAGSIFLIHTFLGGKSVALPLLNTKEIDSTAKYTQYYCWHLVTFTLAMLSVGFIYAGSWAETSEVAWFVTILTAGFSIWGLCLPPLIKQSYLEMPQGFLFLILFLVALLGMI